MTRRLLAYLFGSQTQRRRRGRMALSHVSVEPLEVRTLPSAVIELVTDLNSTPRDQHDQSSALPAQLTVGDLTFFATQTSYHGDTLWLGTAHSSPAFFRSFEVTTRGGGSM